MEMVMDFRDNLKKCEEYIRALEEERVKIQVFQRELPLCFELVTHAIEAYKQQMSRDDTNDANTGDDDQCVNGHSECSEQTTSTDTGPVLEEFIPLKRSDNSNSQDHDDQELKSNKEDISIAQNDNNTNNHHNEVDDDDKSSGKKSDWLRSAQLWNQTPDPHTIQQENQPKRISVVELKKNIGGGAFQPFQKEKSSSSNSNVKPTSAPNTTSSCSSAEAETPCTGGSSGGGGGGGGGSTGGTKEEGGNSQRKSRRCWSPELHKRFVHALQQLGGSHVATPKQIRELMKVDGLTNDEVKSHLQKYRLHTRRPSSANHNTTNPQAPQFVVVGGIWMPPPEYAAMAVATSRTPMDTTPMSAPNGVYAPIATMATPMPCEERGSQSDGNVHSNSPSPSSSTHTTTTSHVY